MSAIDNMTEILKGYEYIREFPIKCAASRLSWGLLHGEETELLGGKLWCLWRLLRHQKRVVEVCWVASL